MTHSEQDEVIVRSTIDLGRNLGLDVVAEGVESAEVLERLRSLGCDVAQGFRMSRPVSADELTSWLNELPARDHGAYWQVESPSTRTGPVVIGATSLNIADVVRAAVDGAEVIIDPAVIGRMVATRGTIDNARGEPVYGVTTGVGPQKRRTVPAEEQGEFNRLMILAHCVGHGDTGPGPATRSRRIYVTWATHPVHHRGGGDSAAKELLPRMPNVERWPRRTRDRIVPRDHPDPGLRCWTSTVEPEARLGPRRSAIS